MGSRRLGSRGAGSRGAGRKFATLLAVTSLSCGLAVAAAGTAQAKVPDAWGYALVLKPAGPVALNHWRESVSPTPTPTASPGVVGQVFVKFPKIGFFKGGVVHATAIIDVLGWCQAQTWRPLGGNEIVAVRCYRKGGVASFMPFTVMFSASSGTVPGGLAYAYVHDTGTSVASSFNSTGMPNIVTALTAGVWRVRLRGPGPATRSGGIQVTAVNATRPVICDVGGQTWTPTEQDVIVRCYDPAGVPDKKTGWNLSYQRGRAITGAKPKLFAYTLNTQPLLAGPYAPLPPAINFNSNAGINKILRAGFGQSLVTFPRQGLFPNTVLVTAASSTARVCNLNTVWSTILAPAGPGIVTVRDVNCYKVSGALFPTQSFITYKS